MAPDRYRRHILVLPEDDADHDLATGFQLEMPTSKERCLQVLPPAGGWISLIEHFSLQHVGPMRKFDKRQLILLMDFDNHAERREQVQAKVPADLTNRVFILGVLSEPEDLKQVKRQSLEAWGSEIARSCVAGNGVWNNHLLRHNLPEVQRMRDCGVIDVLLAE